MCGCTARRLNSAVCFGHGFPMIRLRSPAAAMVPKRDSTCQRIRGRFRFTLWSVVNLWDALVLDTLWFCWGRGVRIPGPEDLEDAYLDVRPHWLGFLAGEAIGLAVSAASAAAVAALSL